MKFFSINSTQELAKILAVAPFEIDHVVANRRAYYRSFKKPKKNGTFRVLYDPRGPLKLLQQKIKTHILDLVPVGECVLGGVRGRSVIDNARRHANKQVVYCLDIKDCFPSVRSSTVAAIFEGLGFATKIAELLARVCTWDNQLPQGVATSTGLANLAMVRVDARLQTLATAHGFSYTRWVDDLTLSGSRRLLSFRRLAQRIVTEEGFVINPEKEGTMHSGMRQIVTGVVVNRKPNVSREERNLIRRGVLQFRASRDQNGASLDRVRGKVSWLSQLNPPVGARLERRLDNRTSGLTIPHERKTMIRQENRES